MQINPWSLNWAGLAGTGASSPLDQSASRTNQGSGNASGSSSPNSGATGNAAPLQVGSGTNYALQMALLSNAMAASELSTATAGGAPGPRTYYIDNSSSAASDDNAGTSASSPFASLAALSKITLKPGDVVAIKAGTVYNVDSKDRAALTLTASGTADQPITITSFGDGAKPVINNTSTASYRDAIDIQGAHDITVNGIAFGSATEAAIRIESDSSHITIENSDMAHVGEGVLLKGTDNLITENYIHDLNMVKNTPTNTTNAATIAATDNDDYGANGVVLAGSGNEVSFNKIVNAKAQSYDYGTDGGGIELFGAMSNISIHDNYVEGSQGFMEAGGYHSLLENINISNNVSYNNGNFIDIHNSGGSFASTFSNIQVSNNTVVDQTNGTKEMATIFLHSTASTSQVNVTNNIFSLNNGDSVFKQQGDYHSNNVIDLQSKDTHLYNDWIMTLGKNETYGDPGLTDTANGDFTSTNTAITKNIGADISAELQAVISGALITSNRAVSDTTGSATSGTPPPSPPPPSPPPPSPPPPPPPPPPSPPPPSPPPPSPPPDSKPSNTKIQTVTASGTTTDTYNAAGVRTSTSVLNNDGSRDETNYAVTGSTYATEHMAYDAQGQLVEQDRHASDGTLVFKKVTDASGTTTDRYDASGALASESIVRNDGSRDDTNYAVSGQNYATEHMAYDAQWQLVEQDRHASDGTLVFKKVTDASGTTTDRYDASGALASESIVRKDGSRDDTNYAVSGQNYATEHIGYDSQGRLIEQDRQAADGTLLFKRVTDASGTKTDRYSAAGLLARESVVHSDGSRDETNDAVSGQTYASEHVAYDAQGKVIEDDRYAADGTLILDRGAGSSGAEPPQT